MTLQLGKAGREPTARPRHTSETVRRMQQAMLSQLPLTSQRPGFLVITQGMLTLMAAETQQLGRDAQTNSPCSRRLTMPAGHADSLSPTTAIFVGGTFKSQPPPPPSSIQRRIRTLSLTTSLYLHGTCHQKTWLSKPGRHQHCQQPNGCASTRVSLKPFPGLQSISQ